MCTGTLPAQPRAQLPVGAVECFLEKTEEPVNTLGMTEHVACVEWSPHVNVLQASGKRPSVCSELVRLLKKKWPYSDSMRRACVATESIKSVLSGPKTFAAGAWPDRADLHAPQHPPTLAEGLH